MTDPATGLGHRLDELATEATHDLQLINPSGSGPDTSASGSGPRLALVGALVAVCLLLAIGGRLAIGGDDDQDPTGGGPTSAGDLAEADGGELPDELREWLPVAHPELDASSARIGPTHNGLTVYSLTTSDRSISCAMVHGPADSEEGPTLASVCSLTASIAVGGAITGEQSSRTFGSTIYGLTSDDVVGVRVGEDDALFENNLFIAGGEMARVETELMYNPDRMAVVEGCESLGPIKRSLSNEGPIDPADLDRLIDSGSRTEDAASLAELAVIVRQRIGEFEFVDNQEMDSDLGVALQAAVETCERARAPGWTIVYGPTAPGPMMGYLGLGTGVDLSSYGVEQILVDTSSPSSAAEGPGLGTITRAAMETRPVTVFEWTTVGEAGLLFCIHIELPGRAKTDCFPEPGQAMVFDIDDAQRSANGEVDADRIVAWHIGIAEFATATVPGQSYVQRSFGRVFVFAVTGDGPVTLTSYDADQNEIGSETVEPD